MDPSTPDARQPDRHSQRTESEPEPDSGESSTDQHTVITRNRRFLVSSQAKPDNIADSTYSKAEFIEPTSLGYIHIGAEVQPPSLPITLLPAGGEKATLLRRLKQCARQLEQLDAVETATVFKAVILPPFHRFPYIKEHTDSLRLARFDIAVLIETRSTAAVPDVQDTEAYGTLVGTIRSEATQMHITAARNEKRIADVAERSSAANQKSEISGDVDKSQDGLFIFNHFVADDATVMLELFDYLAGGYVAETDLDNSTLLVPFNDEDADYVAINNARWDISRLRFLWQELTNPGLRSYVQTNLKANRAGAMPVLYRLA